MNRPLLSWLLCIAPAVLPQCTNEVSTSKPPPIPTPSPSTSRSNSDSAFDPLYPDKVPRTVVFERDLKPMLEIQCVQCHNHVDAKDNAGLNLETRQTAMTTGRRAPVIVPGKPNDSLLVKVLELDVQHPTNMPPSPDKIWGTRLKILKKWIRQGAVWPNHVKMTRPQDQTE